MASRAEAIAALADLVIAEAGDVQVAEGWPGQTLQDECIWFADSTGTVTIPHMRTGRQVRDDTFTLPVHILAGKPGQDARTARARASELAEIVETVLADNPDLEATEGVKWAAQLDVSKDESAAASTEGYEGFCSLNVQFKLRYS